MWGARQVHSAKKIRRAGDCQAFAAKELDETPAPSVSQACWPLMTMKRLRSFA